MTTSRFDSRSTRVPASTRPAASTSCICAASALTKTSTGAPATIWRARLFDPPALINTRVPRSRSKAAASSSSASLKLAAADTTRASWGERVAPAGAAVGRPAIGTASRATATGIRQRRRRITNDIDINTRLTADRGPATLKSRCVNWFIGPTAITITAP
jgi:hypothetical protein